MSYQRKQDEKRRLEKVAKYDKYGTAYYDKDKKRYVKLSLSDMGDSKAMKTQCNRKIRRKEKVALQEGEGDNLNNQKSNVHKKKTEFKWELF